MVRLAYAVCAVLLVTAYFLVRPARPLLDALIGLLAVGATEYGVRQFRPERVGAWRLLAVALAMLAVGDTIFAVLDLRTGGDVPYPSVPDGFYLASYLPLTVALYWLGRPVTPDRDVTTMIDAVSLTLAGSLIVWILVVRPAIATELDLAARIASVAGWVGYVGVLAASVRVVLAWRRNASVTLLGLAVLGFLVSEILYGNSLIEGTWAAGSPVDVGYFSFTLLAGAAALEPSMREVASSANARHVLSPPRLTLIAATLLVAPTALLVEVGLGQVDTGAAIAIVSALVSVLMLIRLSLAGRAYQRRAAREHAARLASQAMVAAMTPDDVVAATRAALRRVVGGRGPVTAELLRGYGRDTRQVGPVPGPAGVDRMVVPLAGTDAALAFTAPPGELSDLGDLLASLADQASLALQRTDLLQATRAEERERYFRTLVMTSTDVIIISRDGAIGYATPSARAMFGRDIVGAQFDGLVLPVAQAPPEEAPRPAQGHASWPSTVLDGQDALVQRADGSLLSVLVHRRDLTDDPSVNGVVTTLRDITEERALKRDLAYRAGHDQLTGLANARTWGESLDAEGDRRRPGEGLGVIFLDLDNFKQINDRHGHPAGDDVLAQVAKRIRAQLRGQDVAARVGGDEFAVLLRGLSGVDDARSVAGRLATALAEPVWVDGVRVECAASIGLSYTEGVEQVQTLVRQADTALYAAKEQGKGRWTEYDPVQWAPARRTPDGDTARKGP